MKQYKTFFLKVGGQEKTVYEIIFFGQHHLLELT
jgi:hypothetical protein